MRKSVHTYGLYTSMSVKTYFQGLSVRKTRIGMGQYRFDIKRKWGYQQNIYSVKSYLDEEFHIKDNLKLYNMRYHGVIL